MDKRQGKVWPVAGGAITYNSKVLAMVEVERIKNVLRRDTVDALPELNRMVGKEYDDATVEAVLEELVEIAIVGQIDSATQSQTVLSDSYYHITQKNKEKIINWIFEYTEKYIDDSMIIFLGFNLLLKLKWRELFVRYIDLYDELIKKEFDDDYIAHYRISQFL